MPVRPATDIARNSTYAALRSACAGDDAKLHRVVRALCGVESYKDVPSANLLALHAWLKPATGGKPANPNATAEIDALLSAVEVTA